MGRVLEQRRSDTQRRLDELRSELTESPTLIADKACVYVTGSGGRGEMSSHSDLDLFIVSDVEEAKPRLRRLDAIVVRAELIKATRKHGFPEFSRDGKYLETYTIDELCKNLGRPEDDHANTFTARLLLLLESRPLLGDAVYQHVIGEVIAPYWKDYEEHKDSFRPVFLINDIARLWKTLCVNYEAYTEQQPDDKRAKRKLMNYKLKHSRVLTCYSAILYLMQVFAERKTVHPVDIRDMVRKSPTERLEWIATRPQFPHRTIISQILERYEQFLDETDRSERELVALFMERESTKAFTGKAHKVGDAVAGLLQKMGADNELYRYLIV